MTTNTDLNHCQTRSNQASRPLYGNSQDRHDQQKVDNDRSRCSSPASRDTGKDHRDSDRLKNHKSGQSKHHKSTRESHNSDYYPDPKSRRYRNRHYRSNRHNNWYNYRPRDNANSIYCGQILERQRSLYFVQGTDNAYST